MRALRGLTAITLAALAVTTATTGAVATDRDDLLDEAADRAPEPTAAVVPGSSVSYVEWPQYNDTYLGEWSGVDAVEVSRTATDLDLVLPDEILSLRFADADVVVDAIAASGPTPSARVGAWTDDFQTGALTVGVQNMLANASAAGITDVGSLEISVDTFDNGVLLDLFVVVLLGDGAAGPAEVTLGVPPVKSFATGYFATDTRVAPGGTIIVEAWPGFFGPEAPQPVTVHRTTDLGWVQLTDPITISADGSRLTMPVPTGVVPQTDMEIRLGDDTTIERWTVTFGLIPASTDAVQEYITAVYNDLFGRDPDPTGLEGWTGALMRGVPYSAVSDAITSSNEFRIGLIRNAYAKYLGRLPDDDGLLGWLWAMQRGLHIQQMEAGFLASQEYFDVWGEGTNGGWIQSLYVDVLGREAAPAEVQAWLPSIARDGREQVARGFLYSTEKLETDVDGYYQWLLRRPLDAVGRVGWVRAIQGGHRVEEIIAGIIASQEYRNNVPVG